MRITGKRLLVTGVTGMMGRALAEHLAPDNTVWGVARFSEPALRARFERQGIHCIALDLAGGDLAALPQDVDILLHFAVAWSLPPNAALDFNGQLVGRILDRLPDLEAYVLGSSVGVYTGGPNRYDLTEASPTIPGGVYGTGKLMGDTLATYISRHRGLPGALLRYWFPYSDEPGVPQNYYEGLVARLQKDETFTLPRDLPGCQQPLFIDDLVRITLDSLRFATPEPFVLNVAGRERLTLKQVLETMGEVFGIAPKIAFDAGGKSDLLSGSYDLARLAATCGLGAVSFRDGLTRLRNRMG